MGQSIEELKLDGKNRRRVRKCPCGKSNKDGKFVPYNGHEKYGYCHSCGNTYFPKEGTIVDDIKPIEKPKLPTWNYLPEEVNVFLGGYHQNNLITWLKKYFTIDQIDRVIVDYKIGTSGYWNGATICFQHDIKERCRYGKVILFDDCTGETIKQPKRKTTRLATTLNKDTSGYELKQCLFGLHLSKKSDTIFLVESEKTAIAFALKYPEAVVMATCGKTGFKYDTIKPIKNKKIIAFPDADAVHIWEKEVGSWGKYGFDIQVVDVIKEYGLQGNEDILDFWLREGGFKPLEEGLIVKDEVLVADKGLTPIERLKSNTMVKMLVEEFKLAFNSAASIKSGEVI